MFELVSRNSRPSMLQALDSMERMMNDLFHFHGVPTIGGIETPSFSPALNISNQNEKYLVEIELPGMSQKNVEISMNDDTLTITGEKKSETKKEDESFCVRECHYGLFRRDIPLPHDVAKNKIEATFDNGILKLNLPKEEKEKESKSKKIEIKKIE